VAGGRPVSLAGPKAGITMPDRVFRSYDPEQAIFAVSGSAIRPTGQQSIQMRSLSPTPFRTPQHGLRREDARSSAADAAGGVCLSVADA
jgi:hypothetical protein